MSPKPLTPKEKQELSTNEKKVGFLAVLAECCNVGRACAAVDVSRQTAYDWRKKDPDFADAMDEAKKIGLTALEDEAHRRAFEGVDEPVFFKAARIATIKKYSDTLAIFLLKAHDPDKYRENHKIDLNAKVEVTDMTEAEIREELAALATAGFFIPLNDDDFSDLV